MTALCIIGTVLCLIVAFKRRVSAVEDRISELSAGQPTSLDTKHQARTRDFLLRRGHGVDFRDRIALCNDLDRIIALPEADVPTLAEWEQGEGGARS